MEIRCPGCGTDFEVLDSILEGKEMVECPICFNMILCSDSRTGKRTCEGERRHHHQPVEGAE